MSQADDGLTGQGTIQYPNYERDEETFQKFLQEHTILKASSNNNNNPLGGSDSDDDSDDDMIPNDDPTNNRSLRRVPCYPPLLERIKNRNYLSEEAQTFVVEIPLSELLEWDSVRGSDLIANATQNTTRYQDLFCRVIDGILTTMQVNNNNGGGNNAHTGPVRHRDTVDILQEQRVAQQQARANAQQEIGGADPAAGGLENDPAMQQQQQQQQQNATEDFPPLLMRRYELVILPVGRKGTHFPFDSQILSRSAANSRTTRTPPPSGVSLRYVRSRSMGRLVTIRGMIVRSSDVKPSCEVATYTCDACGAEVYQVIARKREFMPQRVCPSQQCATHRSSSRADSLHLQTRGSKFTKFQELKLQELPSQVPMGHVPRSLSVHCRGELTRLASPGDVVTIDGVFLPQRVAESGYKAMKAGLVSTTFLEAHNIVVHKKSYDESLLDTLSDEERVEVDTEILKVATGPDPIGALSSAIAPEIFGHDDIKRSLLLQLVGGCTRKLPDGMRIRGDINICLMGDPGVAKSQLLKHVSSIAPRGVYTTGKGSSGVGLTAAVTKDLTTGEMALEGGAMVLADRGLACIDEFDKMDEHDRTAIHEVMEQQTVSIAKAGIVATLNARAAVLAAANPLYGRYNRNKSLSENVNLPNSLLSRFDLMFLILDVADVDKDMALARHVTFVHQNEGLGKTKKSKKAKGDDSDDDMDDEEKEEDSTPSPTTSAVTPKILREYIARARKHHPVVSPDVAPYIVEAYVSLRMQDRPGNSRNSKKAGDQTAMTARQLLSILRLSQALARLRFSDLVAREDVDEAIRLTHMSKASLEEEDLNNNGRGGGNRRRSGDDVMSRVFTILRDYATASRSNSLELKLCEAMVLRKGFTTEQMQSCLEEYEALDVIQVNSTRTHVHFIHD